MADSIRSVKLNNGQEMPLVGLGLWKLPREVAADQVYEAIKLGYRLFDGAKIYENEKEVGQGIRRALDEGLVRREELFVVSKLWNSDHHPDDVRKGLEGTLSDLGLDYLDLYYIHFPLGPEDMNEAEAEKAVPLLETYRALEQLVDEGRIKAIGLSNFQGSLIQDLLRGARIKPAALQIEHHPYLTQERLVSYAKSKGIAVVGYSSFGPLSFLELGHPRAEQTPPLIEHEVVRRIADAHGVTPPQVLLRWATQRDIAIIPKSSKKERLAGNLNIDSAVTLSDSDLRDLSALDRNLRFNDPWEWLRENTPTFV